MTGIRYRESPPSPDLAWAVECFWEAEGPAGGCERIVPDGCPELVVQLGGTMLAGGEGVPLRAQPRALLVGQRSRGLLVSPRAPFQTVAVRLRPEALGAVLGAPAAELTDGWAALDALFGADAGPLIAQREDGGDGVARQGVLERFLRPRLAAARRPVRLEGALALLRRARGRLSVRAVRQATGASERWLERAFLQEVGLAPGTLAAVFRVQAALLLRRSEPSWAALAAALAYCDQAHLTREVRRLAGLPPAALVEALGPLGRAFEDPVRLAALFAVGSVQDPGGALAAG